MRGNSDFYALGAACRNFLAASSNARCLFCSLLGAFHSNDLNPVTFPDFAALVDPMSNFRNKQGLSKSC